ncbi:MAG: hypothetical protein ACYTGL_12980 [Planctomycetota bacterium]|jgi:hypothetical protein
MATHFSQLFWGLLLVILDFKINGFDLLVDGIGYLIVAAGCGGLAELSPRFALARTLSFILAVLWLIGFGITGEAAIAYGFLVLIVNCTFMWQLLGGIAEFAQSRQRPDLGERAHNRRLGYVIVMVVSQLLAIAAQGSRDAAPLAIVLVAAMLILLVMILHLIHRVKHEIALDAPGRETGPQDDATFDNWA